MINKTKISSPLCFWSLPLSSATASWPLSSHNFIHSYLLSYSAYIVESLPLMSDLQLLSLTSLIKLLQLICTLQTVFFNVLLRTNSKTPFNSFHSTYSQTGRVGRFQPIEYGFEVLPCFHECITPRHISISAALSWILQSQCFSQ